jgi:hypothetical protein
MKLSTLFYSRRPQLAPVYMVPLHVLTCGGEFAILRVPGLQDPGQVDSADATVG